MRITKYKINGNFFDNGVEKCKTLHLSDKPAPAWRKMQKASIGEYQRIHMGDVDESVRSMHALFKGYISNAVIARFGLRSHVKILDIGCGVWPIVPEYIDTLSKIHTYVGLDPINENYDRDYLFIHGPMENVSSYLSQETLFDLFVFATSLDHFEKINPVASEVKKIANKRAIAIFCVGLCEPKIMSAVIGNEVYTKIYHQLNPFYFIRQWILTAFIRLPKTYLNFKEREKRLAKNQPIDNKHFHYFTSENILKYIENFGKIIDIIPLVGTNVLFICCEIRR